MRSHVRKCPGHLGVGVSGYILSTLEASSPWAGGAMNLVLWPLSALSDSLLSGWGRMTKFHAELDDQRLEEAASCVQPRSGLVLPGSVGASSVPAFPAWRTPGG